MAAIKEFRRGMNSQKSSRLKIADMSLYLVDLIFLQALNHNFPLLLSSLNTVDLTT